MKPSQYIIVTVIGAVCVGTQAVAQITYTSQNRSISAYVDVAEEVDSQSLSAPDFEIFSDGVTAYRFKEGPGFFDDSYAEAFQHSELLPDATLFFGGAYADQFLTEYGGFSQAYSLFSVEFEVAERTEFSFSAFIAPGLEESTPARVGVARLVKPGSPYVRLSGGSLLEELSGFGDLDFSGFLEPGITYTLLANLEVTNSGEQVGAFVLETFSDVPEPGTTAAGLAMAGLALWQWRRRQA